MAVIARSRNRTGFTIIEMVIVMLLAGVMAAVVLPRAMRTTPQQEVQRTARQLMRDLESARMRAIAAKRVVRMSFYNSEDFYAAFQDTTPELSGIIAETESASRAARFLSRASNAGIPGVELPANVTFGCGTATLGPLGTPPSDPIDFQDDRIEFDARGMVRPVGGVRKGGTIFITHREDPSVISAVTVSGSGAVRTWHYQSGKWR
jgi:prepilin-type N-terminal cleavage/methylation domain-containing protein